MNTKHSQKPSKTPKANQTATTTPRAGLPVHTGVRGGARPKMPG